MTLAVIANAAPTTSYSAFSYGASNVSTPRDLPAFIRRDEVFFWEQEWQAGERASAEERASGGLVKFDSPTELMKWLMTED